MCLIHNLLLLYEYKLQKEHAITNSAEEKRKLATTRKRKQQLAQKGESLPVLYESVQRLTQRSVKFIPWLRNALLTNASLQQALPHLHHAYQTL